MKKWTKYLSIAGFFLGMLQGATHDKFYGLRDIEDFAYLSGSGSVFAILGAVIGLLIDYFIKPKANEDPQIKELDSIKIEPKNIVKKLPKSESHNLSTKGADLNANDLKGSEEWDLAIKYDPILRQAFTDIYKISPTVAIRFKDTLSKTKAFDNYSEIKDKFLKEVLGLNAHQKVYFQNEFLNEIAEALLHQNSLAAAEFIKLVSIYNLESSTDSADGIAKIFEWLKKVEDSYKVSVRDKLVLAKDILPESNGFQIKHQLYEKFEELGHICYLLYNGNCVIVRSSEYRIYDSKKSAIFALTDFTDYAQWTVKNLVDKLDINADLKYNNTLSSKVNEEKKSPKKISQTVKKISMNRSENKEERAPWPFPDGKKS